MNVPIEVLSIEDSPSDTMLIREFLKCGAPGRNLNFVSNGRDAVDYLWRRGRFAAAQRPDLILLDINIPLIDGHEVLRLIKRDPLLRRIPVIVLSSSSHEYDVSAAYEESASCYCVKPTSLDDFEALMKGIEAVWLKAAHLPGQWTEEEESLSASR